MFLYNKILRDSSHEMVSYETWKSSFRLHNCAILKKFAYHNVFGDPYFECFPANAKSESVTEYATSLTT